MIRIAIADDHALIRAGLKEILAARPNIQVIEATNGQELINKVKTLDIDVAILDISMPGRNGLETLKEVRVANPKVSVLILSVYPEDQYAIRALKAGASGYLTKDSAPEMLLSAIDKLLKGEKFISPNLANKLVSELDHTNINKLPHEQLSDREFEVLKQLGSGSSVSEIAEVLFLSPKTISTYRTRILQKMALKNNADLIHYVIEYDLLNR